MNKLIIILIICMGSVTFLSISGIDARDVYCSYLNQRLNDKSILWDGAVGHWWGEQDKWCYTNQIAIQPFEYDLTKLNQVGIEYHCVIGMKVQDKFAVIETTDFFGNKDYTITQIHDKGTCVGFKPKGI